MTINKNPDVANLYHLHSSHVRSRLTDLARDEDRRPFQFRTYPGAQRVDLPGQNFDLDVKLGDVLRRRASVREFQRRTLDQISVGRLLYASFGVRGYRKVGKTWIYDRPWPSAGGLHPLEIYIAAQGIEKLTDGVYHYDARAHQLELRQNRLLQPELVDVTLGQDMVRDANLVIIISAIFQRTMWKYGQRGYRYVWLDAGHVGQNLHLVAMALGLGAVGIGGFFDGELNGLLDLPSEEEQAIYLLCVGYPKETDGEAHSERQGIGPPT